MCDHLLSTHVCQIHNIFEFINFHETKTPTNIVFAHSSALPLAEDFRYQYSGVVEVGLLEDEALVSLFGIEYAQLARPTDSVIINISEADLAKLESERLGRQLSR
jgi:hypothetical protein